jgi:hypothetical protein
LSSSSSHCGTTSASGLQKLLRSISAQSQRMREALMLPTWIKAPRISTGSGSRCASTLRAIAPAATREAVSRADERPPPR